MKLTILLMALLIAGPNVVNSAEICFSEADGTRLLEEVEASRAYEKGAEESLSACSEEKHVLSERVTELDGEVARAEKTIEDTRKAGEQAAKAANVPWYQRVLNAGKWIGLGILLGFAVGVGK